MERDSGTLGEDGLMTVEVPAELVARITEAINDAIISWVHEVDSDINALTCLAAIHASSDMIANMMQAYARSKMQ